MTKAIVPAQAKQQQIKDLLEKAKPSLLQVLPKHVTPDRLVKIALSACNRNAALMACKPLSLLKAVFQAGELGLEAGGLLGEAYLVPYGNEVQCIAGYRGLVKLARQSGQIASIEARIVCERDTFELEYGLAPKLVHRPYLGGDAGQIVFVYAVATFREGEKQIDVMSRFDVDAIRKRSKASESGPWVTDYAEMAKKTVVRRLCKMLPLSPELARAIEHEAAVDDGVPSPVGIDVSLFQEDEQEAPKETANGSRTDALKAKLVETEVA